MFRFLRSSCSLVFLLLFSLSYGQLSFCPGNTGDPIFEEDFGQGSTNGPPLPANVTSYTYVDQAPQDGQYTISSSLGQLGGFHSTDDHTGNTNGKAFIVNASFDPGLFYQIPIQGLCENNSYEFSAFLMNLYNTSTQLCDGTGIPVNVKFQIWDETDTSLLAEGDTGNINGSSTPNWQQFALTFTTLDDQNAVILKMLNNGEGGCGNDLAIDDIVFRSCGDETDVISEENDESITICGNETLDEPITLSAEPDFSVYDSHFYQWQFSTDGDNWSDIPGETNEQLIIDPFQAGNYRTLVAEDPVNVDNTLCNSISNVFILGTDDPLPVISLGDQEICDGEVATLAVQEESSVSVNWYDQPEGGDPLVTGSFTYETDQPGTYYAESITNSGGCIPDDRTSVTLSINEVPIVNDQVIERCADEEVTLTAGASVAEYEWSNGSTDSEISVVEDGEFTVELITAEGCSTTQTFTVSSIAVPVIEEVISFNDSIKIEMANTGDFSYSIDGANFQDSPLFNNVEGGLYDVVVQENNGCGQAVESILHLVVPDYFSPNADGYNDRLVINDIEVSSDFSFYVFDRYGKLVFSARNKSFAWDGTFQGKKLPSSDYWYKLKIDQEVFTGNITLKR